MSDKLPRTVFFRHGFSMAGGEEVMTPDEFARWWDDQAEARKGGARFADELRLEVAKRRSLSNFRQLKVVGGSSDSWLVRP